MKIPYFRNSNSFHLTFVPSAIRTRISRGIYIFLLCFDPLFVEYVYEGCRDTKGVPNFMFFFFHLDRFETVIQNIHSILSAAKIFEFQFLFILFFYFTCVTLKLMKYIKFLCGETCR